MWRVMARRAAFAGLRLTSATVPTRGVRRPTRHRRSRLRGGPARRVSDSACAGSVSTESRWRERRGSACVSRPADRRCRLLFKGRGAPPPRLLPELTLTRQHSRFARSASGWHCLSLTLGDSADARGALPTRGRRSWLRGGEAWRRSDSAYAGKRQYGIAPEGATRFRL